MTALPVAIQRQPANTTWQRDARTDNLTSTERLASQSTTADRLAGTDAGSDFGQRWNSGLSFAGQQPSFNTSAAPAPQSGEQYVVRAGDTLFSIAANHNVSLPQLLDANPQISNPGSIRQGQIINLPSNATGGGQTPDNTGSGGSTSQVTVRPGDTLTGIAVDHGVTLVELLNANPQISNLDGITPGQIVNLPAHATGGSQTPDDNGPVDTTGQVTVRSGDTLSSIAANHDVSLTELLAANPQISNPNNISVGQVINLPANATGGDQTPDVNGPPPAGPERGLSEADFQSAADLLGVDVATVKAIAEVESARAGFLPSGDPSILFEAHVFGDQTGDIYNQSHPTLSSASWDRSLYGPAGQHQHDRLAAAMELNESAALKSASWGAFQIMGFNHAAAGYDNVHDFVAAMRESESKQLDAFVNFVNAHPQMVSALQNKQWATFARHYNGPAYAENNYDTKIAAAYARHSN